MNYLQPGYVRTGHVRLDSDGVGPFIFDGYGKRIIVSPALVRLDVAQMYSRWQDWSQLEYGDDSNYKWQTAMRYSGNDPIPGGLTGATFFMTNGWRVVYDPNSTSVEGVLFSEDFATAYWTRLMQPVYPVSVSAVVNQVTITGVAGTALTPEQAEQLAALASLLPSVKRDTGLIPALL